MCIKFNHTSGKAILLSQALALAALFSFFGAGCSPSHAEPSSAATTLTNGLRVLAVQFPGSTNAAIFTFIPMGLAMDGPGQAQWSHLVEHLVIRSTIPQHSTTANAETLPDHMRLDYYATTNNWLEGLKHHRDWLAGRPFTEEKLRAEKPNVISECDFTAKNFATHKFAMAAWAQGYRFDRDHAALKADVEAASLADIQRYRDERLPAIDRALICVVGGLKPEQVFPEIEKQFASLSTKTTPAAAMKVRPRSREMTWDLDARHVVYTWPIPNSSDTNYAAIRAAQGLSIVFSQDAELQKLTGMILAGADLVTPEGTFFYISASLRPDATFRQVQDRLEHHLKTAAAEKSNLAIFTMMARQIAQNFTTIPNPRLLKSQVPPNVTESMLEMNIGLQFAMHEYLYRDRRNVVAARLNSLTQEQIRAAIHQRLHLTNATIVTLIPKPITR